MKKVSMVAALFFLAASVCYAKHDYPYVLNVTSVSTQVVGTQNSAKGTGSILNPFHSKTTNVTARDVYATMVVNGQNMHLELTPQNAKESLLIGSYPARADGSTLIVENGKKEVKFTVDTEEAAK